MTALFQSVCESKGWETPVPEYRFAPPRRWRFDWAFIESRIAVEIEGGAWTRGRHTRGAGFIKDIEKYNAATVLGWRVLRCTPKQFEGGDVFALIEKLIKEKP